MFSRVLAFCVALLYILAIINPYRYMPIPSFSSEMLVFVGVIFSLILFIYNKIEFPKITLPLLWISAIPVVQYAFGEIYFLQNAFFSTLYIFTAWLVLSMSFSLTQTRFINEPPKENVMYVLSWALLIAGVLSCALAISQWLHLDLNTNLILRFIGDRPYANLGQPNLFATSLMLSIFALLFLFEKKAIKILPATLLSIVLIFNLSLTLSRTALLVCIFTITFLWIKSNQFQLKRRYMLLWFGFFMVCTFTLPYINEFITQFLPHAPKAEMRSLAQRSGAGFERVQMWQQILAAVWERPFLGYGWGQTSAAQYMVAGEYPVHVWLTSAHNIIIDILAWNGLVLGGAIVIYLGYFLVQLFLNTRNLVASCAFLMLIPVITHAMLEYPLFYIYYLIPVAICAGIILAQSHTAIAKYQVFYYFPRMMIVVGLILFGTVGYFYYRKVPIQPEFSFFDKLETRTQWTRVPINAKLSRAEINRYRHSTQCHITHYDMHKFAQTLLYNGDVREGLEVMKKVNSMYNQHYTYAELLYAVEKYDHSQKNKIIR